MIDSIVRKSKICGLGIENWGVRGAVLLSHPPAPLQGKWQSTGRAGRPRPRPRPTALAGRKNTQWVHLGFGAPAGTISGPKVAHACRHQSATHREQTPPAGPSPRCSPAAHPRVIWVLPQGGFQRFASLDRARGAASWAMKAAVEPHARHTNTLGPPLAGVDEGEVKQRGDRLCFCRKHVAGTVLVAAAFEISRAAVPEERVQPQRGGSLPPIHPPKVWVRGQHRLHPVSQHVPSRGAKARGGAAVRRGRRAQNTAGRWAWRACR